MTTRRIWPRIGFDRGLGYKNTFPVLKLTQPTRQSIPVLTCLRQLVQNVAIQHAARLASPMPGLQRCFDETDHG